MLPVWEIGLRRRLLYFVLFGGGPHLHDQSPRLSGIDNSININYSLSMKTAISIPEDIFVEVKKIAQEHNYSRSKVFVIAVKEFLEKLRSQKLLEALNAAYSDVESKEEKTLRERSKRYYTKRVIRRKIDNQAR